MFVMAVDFQCELEHSNLRAGNTQPEDLRRTLQNKRLGQWNPPFPFMRLPKELRLNIWTAMISNPRVIHIRKATRRLHFICSSPTPITLQICGESRDSTITLFNKFYIRSETDPRPVYFRKDLDIISLDMTKGVLEFVWQHPQVNELTTVVINKKALEHIRSSTMLHSDSRWFLFLRHTRFLLVTGRSSKLSHGCAQLKITQLGRKQLEKEGWESWISSFRGVQVRIQSARMACGCVHAL